MIVACCIDCWIVDVESWQTFTLQCTCGPCVCLATGVHGYETSHLRIVIDRPKVCEDRVTSRAAMVTSPLCSDW